MKVQQVDKATEALTRGEGIVAKNIFDVLTARLFQAPIPIFNHAEVLLVQFKSDAFIATRVASDNFGAVVSRSVITHQEFEIDVFLREDRIQSLRQISPIVIRGNEDAHLGVRRMHGMATKSGKDISRCD